MPENSKVVCTAKEDVFKRNVEEATYILSTHDYTDRKLSHV